MIWFSAQMQHPLEYISSLLRVVACRIIFRTLIRTSLFTTFFHWYNIRNHIELVIASLQPLFTYSYLYCQISIIAHLIKGRKGI